MKTFSVYRHRAKGYQAVKHGFSWAGLIGGYVWLTWYRMWLPLMILLSINSVVWYFEYFDPTASEMLRGAAGWIDNLLINIIVGWFGNQWLMPALERKGYDFIGNFSADNAAAATAKARRKTADEIMGLGR